MRDVIYNGGTLNIQIPASSLQKYSVHFYIKKKENIMKITIRVIVAVLAILLFFIGCQKQDTEADIAAINELLAQYCIKANAGDIEGFMSLWADDAIRMEPDRTSIVGKENIQAFFAPQFELFDINVAIYGDTEVQVFGDLSFSRGTYTLSITPKQGGPTTTLDGKWLDIEKRQADGSWKIYVDMVNFNKPPVVE